MEVNHICSCVWYLVIPLHTLVDLSQPCCNEEMRGRGGGGMAHFRCSGTFSSDYSIGVNLVVSESHTSAISVSLLFETVQELYDVERQ
jgi:hypothetical protein